MHYRGTHITDPTAHTVCNPVERERLCDDRIHPRTTPLIRITARHMRGQRDNRGLRAVVALLKFTNALCRLIPVHSGHAAIHKHQRIINVFELFHRLAPIQRNVGRYIQPAQRLDDHFPIDRIVIGNQHPRAAKVRQILLVLPPGTNSSRASACSIAQSLNDFAHAGR